MGKAWQLSRGKQIAEQYYYHKGIKLLIPFANKDLVKAPHLNPEVQRSEKRCSV